MGSKLELVDSGRVNYEGSVIKNSMFCLGREIGTSKGKISVLGRWIGAPLNGKDGHNIRPFIAAIYPLQLFKKY